MITTLFASILILVLVSEFEPGGQNFVPPDPDQQVWESPQSSKCASLHPLITYVHFLEMITQEVQLSSCLKLSW